MLVQSDLLQDMLIGQKRYPFRKTPQGNSLEGILEGAKQRGFFRKKFIGSVIFQRFEFQNQAVQAHNLQSRQT